jgi:hypothetical protein
MSCCVEDYKNYDVPVFAGTSRFLLGLLLALAGLYVAALTDIQGHGVGLLLTLGSPFVVFTDKK